MNIILNILENSEELLPSEFYKHRAVDCVTACAQFNFQVNGKCYNYFPSSFRLCCHKLIGEKCSPFEDISSLQHSQTKRSMSHMNK